MSTLLIICGLSFAFNFILIYSFLSLVTENKKEKLLWSVGSGVVCAILILFICGGF